jgi:hypothetical protein
MKNLETDDVEIIDRHSVRITVLGKGTFDEFTARLEKILPISTPAEIVREAKTWIDVVNKVEIKAPLSLFIYRKGRKEVEPLSLRADRVSTRKDHFYAKESKCRSR